MEIPEELAEQLGIQVVNREMLEAKIKDINFRMAYLDIELEKRLIRIKLAELDIISYSDIKESYLKQKKHLEQHLKDLTEKESEDKKNQEEFDELRIEEGYKS